MGKIEMTARLVLILFLLAMPALAQGREMTSSELRQIVQAGGSLIVELEKHNLSVSELAMLAGNLKEKATLTIKTGPRAGLTANQCAQIVRARSGQVIFWF